MNDSPARLAALAATLASRAAKASERGDMRLALHVARDLTELLGAGYELAPPPSGGVRRRVARIGGPCRNCGDRFGVGEEIIIDRASGFASHFQCGEPEPEEAGAA